MAQYVAIKVADLQVFQKELMRPLGQLKNAATSTQQPRVDPNANAGLQRIVAAMNRISGKSFTIEDLNKILKDRMDEVRDVFSDGVKEIRKIASDTVRRDSEEQEIISARTRARMERNFDDFGGMLGEFVNHGRRMISQLKNMVFESSGPTTKVTYAASGGSMFQRRGTDTVPAMLTPGEFVVPAEMAKRYANLLVAMQKGQLEYLSNGGAAGGVQYLARGGRVSFPPNTRLMDAKLSELRDAVADAIKDNIPSLASNMGGGGSGGSGGGGGRDFSFDTRAEDAKQQLIRDLESFGDSAKTGGGRLLGNLVDKFRDLTGVMQFLSTNTLFQMLSDTVDTTKAVNNLTGATMSGIDVIEDHQAALIRQNNGIRRGFGFTQDQVRETEVAILNMGVTGTDVLTMLSKQSLLASRAMGIGAGEAAEHYGKMRKDLRLSVRSMSSLAMGSIRVAKQTGMTARSVMEIQRGLSEQIELYRKLGIRDVRAIESATRVQAIGQQFGTQDILSTFQQSAAGIDQFDQAVGKLGVAVALARSELLNLRDASGQVKYSFMDLQSGRVLRTEGGRRDVMRATAMALERLETTTANMPEEFANTFIAQYTNNEIRSRDQLVDAIRSAQTASMSPAEQVKALEAVQSKIGDMQKAGWSSQQIEEQIKGLTAGFGDINSQKDLNERLNAVRMTVGEEPLRNLAEAGDRMRQLVTQYMSSAGGNMSPAAAEAKAFEQVRGQFREINGTLGYTAKDLRNAVSQREELDQKNLEKNADQSIQNIKDQFGKAREQALAIGMAPLEYLLASINGTVNKIAYGLGALTSIVTVTAGAMGAMKIFGAAGKTIFGDFFNRKRALTDLARQTFPGGEGAAGSVGEMAGGRGKNSSPVPDAGSGRGAASGVGGFLTELVKVAAVIAVVGLTMTAMSKFMPMPEKIWETTQSLLISLGAFSAFYLALQAFQQISKKFGGLDVKTIFVKGIMPTLLAMAVIGPALAGVMWLTSKAWSIMPLSEMDELKGKMVAAAPVLGVLMGAAVAMAVVGGLASKVPKQMLIGAALAIPVILLGMAALGAGLALTMKGVSAAWDMISLSEIQQVDAKFRASLPVLGSLLAGTLIMFTIGGVLGAIAATGAAAPFVLAALIGAALAIPLILGGMAALGAGLALVMKATAMAWEMVSLREIQDVDEKFRGSMIVMGALLAGTLLIGGLNVVAAAAALAAMANLPAVMSAMSKLGEKLAVVVKRTSEAWKNVDLEDTRQLDLKFRASAGTLAGLFLATALFASLGPVSAAGTALDYVGAGPMATLHQMEGVGAQMGTTINGVANGWDMVSVEEIQGIEKKVTGSATALASLYKAAALYTATGPLASVGGVMDWLGFGSGSTLDQMVSVSTQIADVIRRLAGIYDASFPDVAALNATITKVNSLMSSVVTGIIKLAAANEDLDADTINSALSAIRKMQTMDGELRAINVHGNAPGAGNMTAPIDLDAPVSQVLAASDRSRTNQATQAVDSPGIERLVQVAQRSLNELTMIRAALSFTPKSDPRRSGNAGKTLGNMYTERTGELNTSPYQPWNQAVAGDTTETSTQGTG